MSDLSFPLFNEAIVYWFLNHSVESPSHPIRFQMDAESANRGKVTLGTQEAALDRDFVLLIVQRDAHRPGLWLDKDRQAVMLSVLPQFRALEHNCEFIFLGTNTTAGPFPSGMLILAFLHTVS